MNPHALALAVLGCLPEGVALGQSAAPPSGPGSLTGIWSSVDAGVRTADGQPIPLQPAAAAVAEKARLQAGGKSPLTARSCLTQGMPSVMNPAMDLPINILETRGQITILIGRLTTFRIIHLNEKHPADPDPTFMGNSVGHWEGNTLVVDTIALSEKTTVTGLIPHGEDLHLVERLRRTGKDTLEDRITVKDPATFTRPWTQVIQLQRASVSKLKEDFCEVNPNGGAVLGDGA